MNCLVTTDEMKSNLIGIWTIYLKEMSRTSRVIGQTIFSPVITTTLYFVVFGAQVPHAGGHHF